MALRAVTWDVWGRNQLSKPFQKYLSLLDFLALNLQYKKLQYFLLTHFGKFGTLVVRLSMNLMFPCRMN